MKGAMDPFIDMNEAVEVEIPYYRFCDFLFNFRYVALCEA